MRSHTSQSSRNVPALPSAFMAAASARLVLERQAPKGSRIIQAGAILAGAILALGFSSARAAGPVRDPFLSPPPGASGLDSSAAMPMQEAVKLSTQGAFTAPAARVGDSLDYVVSVEWEDNQV